MGRFNHLQAIPKPVASHGPDSATEIVREGCSIDSPNLKEYCHAACIEI